MALIFISLFISVLAFAKQESTLDESEWKKLTDDVDYVEQNREAPQFNWPNFGFDINPQVVQYIFFTIIIGVLLYVLIKYVIALQAAGVSQNDDTDIEVQNLKEAEANPMQADLKSLIAKLVAQGDYRGATRAYFLLVLQRMHRKKLIAWSKPKTNFDYVHEVQHQPFCNEFTGLTNVFEHVWYGEHAIDRAHFADNEKKFQQLLAKLPNE